MKKVLVFVALWLLLMAGSVQAETVSLTMGAWPPYTTKTVDGKGIGITTELVTAAFKAVGLDTEISIYPSKRNIAMIKNGDVAGSFPWAKTPEREKFGLYSDPIHKMYDVFFYKKSKYPSGIGFNNLNDLKKYKIAGCVNYWYEGMFKKAGLNVEYGPKVDACFKKVLAGRVDITPGDYISSLELIKQLFPGKENLFGSTKKTLKENQLRVLFSKKHPNTAELVKKFNEGLAKIRADGTFKSIVAKHGLKLD